MILLMLAAGKGSRLKEMNITNKCFIEIGGKHLIDYNLELLNRELLEKIIIVVGHNAEHIKKYLGNSIYGIEIQYVEQETQLGIAHAVKTAAPYIDSDFFMCLSDEILISPNIYQMYDYFYSTKAACVCGVVKDSPENIKKAYTITTNDDQQIEKLVEKPQEVFNHFKGTGYCMMTRDMLAILDNLSPNPIRNEYEMGDWIQKAVDEDLDCRIFQIADYDFNINEQSDMQRAMLYIGGQV